MPYVYESHLGGLYESDEQLDNNELYCEECGDSDWKLGYYEDLGDLWSLLKNETSIFGCGGYQLSHIARFFCGKPIKELEKLDDLELLAIIAEAIGYGGR